MFAGVEALDPDGLVEEVDDDVSQEDLREFEAEDHRVDGGVGIRVYECPVAERCHL